jgi:hypothetical protein
VTGMFDCHFVLIRSSFSPEYGEQKNRNRLELTKRVTVPSLSSQSVKNWSLAVLVNPLDPLLEERKAVFEEVGVPTHFLTNNRTGGRPFAVARAGYSYDWLNALGIRDKSRLTTRIDDDDAFHPTTLERVQVAAKELDCRTALIHPNGYIVWDGRYTELRHPTNMLHTLYSSAGDPIHVYSYIHTKVRETVPTIDVDEEPAWIWLRHPDAVSRCFNAERQFDEHLKAQFQIDWDYLCQLKS